MLKLFKKSYQSIINIIIKVTTINMNSNETKHTQTSEKQLLESSLKKLLSKKSESVVISIKGSWGIGKSYFWNKFANKNIHGKYAYVSLFGKTSLEGIKQDIIFQISSMSKFVDKIKDKIGSTKVLGIDISSSLSILDKSDFKNIIVCFDDFERISKSVDIKDVIGLISELKEQKHCKIVIINNNDQLQQNDDLNNIKVSNMSDKEFKYLIETSNNKKSFDLFSEKIIDFEFCYCPTIEENFNEIKNKIKYFDTEHILDYLESSNENDKLFKNFNIRLHKKLIHSLNIFSFLEEEKISHEIKKAIGNYICRNIYGNQMKSTNYFELNIDPLCMLIDSALEKSFLVDKAMFLIEINKLQDKFYNSEGLQSIKLEAEGLYNDYQFNLTYSNLDFENKMFNLFNENKNRIIDSLGLNNFKNYLNLLIKLNTKNKDQYDQFLIEASQLHIDNIFKNQPTSGIDYYGLKQIFIDYSEIISYINIKIQDQGNLIKSDITNLIQQLNKPRKERSWSPEDELFLSSISIESHVENMTKSKEYLYAAFKFAQYINSFSGIKPFKETYSNILISLTKLSNISEDYKLKLENLINALKPRQ